GHAHAPTDERAWARSGSRGEQVIEQCRQGDVERDTHDPHVPRLSHDAEVALVAARNVHHGRPLCRMRVCAHAACSGRLSSCTASSSAATCSGGVNCDTPCPRLNTCPDPLPKDCRTLPASARTTPGGANRTEGSRLPCSATRAPTRRRASPRS